MRQILPLGVYFFAATNLCVSSYSLYLGYFQAILPIAFNLLLLYNFRLNTHWAKPLVYVFGALFILSFFGTTIDKHQSQALVFDLAFFYRAAGAVFGTFLLLKTKSYFNDEQLRKSS